MNCLIIEDQLPAQRIIQKYLIEIPFLRLIQTCGNAIEAMEYVKNNQIDLIFLDINLPKISGINFLKNLSKPPQVIITSAYSEYALEGFELDVADYLLKPFSFERFHKAIMKVPNAENKSLVGDFIFIKCDKEFFKIEKSSILYIKGDDDFTKVYTENKMYMDNRTLKVWITDLSAPFLRIHKSFIVNLKFVTRIAGNRAYLQKTELPIGRSYKDDIMQLIDKGSKR